MNWTQKTYEMIAKVLREQVERTSLNDDAKDMVRLLAWKFSEEFSADNSRFDRYRFLGACGV